LDVVRRKVQLGKTWHLDSFFILIFVHEATLQGGLPGFFELFLKFFLFFFTECVIVSVCTPEPRQELFLSDILSLLFFGNDSAEEDLELRFCHVEVAESD
jgi:hypothetical protein